MVLSDSVDEAAIRRRGLTRARKVVGRDPERWTGHGSYQLTDQRMASRNRPAGSASVGAGETRSSRKYAGKRMLSADRSPIVSIFAERRDQYPDSVLVRSINIRPGNLPAGCSTS